MFENYVYPPRPEKQLPPESLQRFDDMEVLVAQPKLNGSCCVAVCNGAKTNFYNRTKETFTSFIFSKEELRSQYEAQGLTIFVGEYLNKSQNNEKGENTNGHLVLFDILWYDGKSLVDVSFTDRQKLLRSIFKIKEYNKWIDQISENLFIVKNFENGFKELWDEIIQIDVYEGLVLKMKDSILKPGTSSKNNTDWQLKCRKPTKNYSF